MSKSIKESSINLGDTLEELYEKIVRCGKRNEEIILQMMILASNWNRNEVEKAKNAFENREKNYSLWLYYKRKYYNFFADIKRLWDDSKEECKINTYYELFK